MPRDATSSFALPRFLDSIIRHLLAELRWKWAAKRYVRRAIKAKDGRASVDATR